MGGEIIPFSSPFSPVPVTASEEETIDSFDTYPSNRWVETKGGSEAIISNGQLNITDIGDDTNDIYMIERGLRSLDSKIEVKFKIDINKSSTTNDVLFIQLLDPDDVDVYSSFFIENGTNTGFYSTYFNYDDEHGNYRVHDLIGNERIYDNLWYVLKIDYDILKSTIRFRLYFENDTRIFDYKDSEITGVYRNGLWKAQNLRLRIYYKCRTNALRQEVLLEYVKAPFKEREWRQTFTPTDPDWVTDTWEGHRVNDDIDDGSKWELTVTYLDSCSFSIDMWTTDVENLVTMDYSRFYFDFMSVNPATGGTIDDFILMLEQETGGGGTHMELEYNANGGGYISCTDSSPAAATNGSSIQFTVSLSDDRTKGTVKYQCHFWDGMPSSPGVIEFSVTYPQECIFMLYTDLDFDGDTQFNLVVRDHTIVTQDIFTGLAIGLLAWALPAGANFLYSIGLGFIVEALIALGRFIAGIFKSVIDGLGLLLAPLLIALGPLLGAIETAINTIWEGIGESLDFIADFIWPALQDAIDDILRWAFEALGGLISTVVGWLINCVFWLWDSANLPDILAWLDFILDYLTEFITWALTTANTIVTFLVDISWILLVAWWTYAVFIQFARAHFEPAAGIGYFIEAWFANIIPVDILGIHIHIPQGLVFTFWLLFLIPNDFALFTAINSL